jgi:hypothetical protein
MFRLIVHDICLPQNLHCLGSKANVRERRSRHSMFSTLII